MARDAGYCEAWRRASSRLRPDHIDLYYLHLDDLATPLEETVDAMGTLVREGKIRLLGRAQFPRRGASPSCQALRSRRRPATGRGQPYYNAVNRMPEVEYLPVCEHHGIGVVPYSPLARGVLTGKYRPKVAPDPASAWRGAATSG